MIIAITGTPCTGKTKTSGELAKKLKKIFHEKSETFKVIHLNEIVLRKKFYTSIDRKRKSKNVDMKKLRNFVKKQTGNLIIESHFSHDFDANLVFVLRCPIKELERRMKKKAWNKQKIEENLEAERINLILGEALDRHGRRKVFEVGSGANAVEEMARIVKKAYKP